MYYFNDEYRQNANIVSCKLEPNPSDHMSGHYVIVNSVNQIELYIYPTYFCVCSGYNRSEECNAEYNKNVFLNFSLLIHWHSFYYVELPRTYLEYLAYFTQFRHFVFNDWQFFHWKPYIFLALKTSAQHKLKMNERIQRI